MEHLVATGGCFRGIAITGGVTLGWEELELSFRLVLPW